MHAHAWAVLGRGWADQHAARAGGDLPIPPSVLHSRSPCQPQKLISTKSNKQGPAQGPGPYLESWRHTGNLTSVTSAEVAFSSDALAASLCTPRAGDAQSWQQEVASPGSAHPSPQGSWANRTDTATRRTEREQRQRAAITHTCHCCGEKVPEKTCAATKAKSITHSPSHCSGRASKENKKKEKKRKKA